MAESLFDKAAREREAYIARTRRTHGADTRPLWEQAAVVGGGLAAAALVASPVGRAAAAAVGRLAAGLLDRAGAGMIGPAAPDEDATPSSFESPQSTAVAGASWNGHTVTIHWKSGGTSRHSCGRDEWTGFYEASSKGGYTHEVGWAG